MTIQTQVAGFTLLALLASVLFYAFKRQRKSITGKPRGEIPTPGGPPPSSVPTPSSTPQPVPSTNLPRIKRKPQEKSTSTQPQQQEETSMTPEQIEAKVSQLKEEGNTCIKNRDYLGALKHYGDAINLQPNSILYGNRALANYCLRSYESCLDDANKSIEYDPKYTKAYHRKVTALTKLDRLAEALTTCNEVLQIDANYSPIIELRDSISKELEKNNQPQEEEPVAADSLGEAELPTVQIINEEPESQVEVTVTETIVQTAQSDDVVIQQEPEREIERVVSYDEPEPEEQVPSSVVQNEGNEPLIEIQIPVEPVSDTVAPATEVDQPFIQSELVQQVLSDITSKIEDQQTDERTTVEDNERFENISTDPNLVSSDQVEEESIVVVQEQITEIAVVDAEPEQQNQESTQIEQDEPEAEVTLETTEAELTLQTTEVTVETTEAAAALLQTDEISDQILPTGDVDPDVTLETALAEAILQTDEIGEPGQPLATVSETEVKANLLEVIEESAAEVIAVVPTDAQEIKSELPTEDNQNQFSIDETPERGQDVKIEEDNTNQEVDEQREINTEFINESSATEEESE